MLSIGEVFAWLLGSSPCRGYEGLARDRIWRDLHQRAVFCSHMRHPFPREYFQASKKLRFHCLD